MKGLEPPRLTALEPKSSVSANFTTSACNKLIVIKIVLYIILYNLATL
jgi:hypothetical protein